uniref:Uncharacterized protein n=1 Tax=Glossina pallidipes TaxID=7398 RepID=A0A1A9ZJE0_GLOPL
MAYVSRGDFDDTTRALYSQEPSQTSNSKDRNYVSNNTLCDIEFAGKELTSVSNHFTFQISCLAKRSKLETKEIKSRREEKEVQSDAAGLTTLGLVTIMELQQSKRTEKLIEEMLEFLDCKT